MAATGGALAGGDGGLLDWASGNGRRVVGTALATLLVVGSVVALVRGNGGSGDDDQSAAGEDAQYSVSDEAATASGGAVEHDDAATADREGLASVAPPVPIAPEGDGSAIVRSASMSVRLDDLTVTAAVDRLGAAVAGMGGWVASTTTAAGEGGTGTAELVLRVPSERLEEARAMAAELGETTSVRLSGQDVSGQLVDVDARLRALGAEELALLDLLGRAGEVRSILEVRDRLSGVRTEIEQLNGRQASLRDRVRMASLAVSLTGEAAATSVAAGSDDGVWDRFGDDLATAGRAVVAVVGGTIIVAAALAPFALAALVAWFVYRLRTRRRVATS